MKPNLTLGALVQVTAVYEKVGNYDNLAHRSVVSFKEKEIPVTTGIYVGYRTALTGYITYDEDGPQFKARGKINYLLVVINPRQNPIRVPYEHAQPKPTPHAN